MVCFRLETLMWVFQLVFGICALLVGFTLSAKKKSKKRRRWPTLSYFRTRVQVQEWLDTTHNSSSGNTRMEDFSLKLSEIVCKDLANAKEDKEKIEAYLEEQIKDFQTSQRRPNEVREALIYDTFRRLIKTPSDPIGQRRASIMKKIITNSFEKQGKESKPNEKCSNLKPYVLDSSAGPIFPSEAYPMNNRVIFYMTYMVMMPLCWVVSTALLHWYLEKDNMKMEFRQEQRNEKQGLARLMRLLISDITQNFKPTLIEEGFWVDLNTESEDGMDVEDFVNQFEAIENVSDVTVDNENEGIVTDAVWKETTFMGTVSEDKELKNNDDMEGEMETEVDADAIVNTDDKLCESIPLTLMVPHVETEKLLRVKEIQRSFDCWRTDCRT